MERQRRAAIDLCGPVTAGESRRSPRSRLPSPLLGVVGTGLLHALWLPSILWGSGGRADRPPLVPNDVQADIMLLPATTENAAPADMRGGLSNPAIDDLATTLPTRDSRKAATLPPLAVPDLPPDDPQSAAAQNAGDGAEYARLYGIYSGQIQARIDRLWRRPRSPIAESPNDNAGESTEFRCLVNIIQDQHGAVLEVLLPDCNGSSAWQRSLAIAIQQASPLPAPPDAKVFRRSIALTFVGQPYSSTAAADEYEIAGR